MMFRLIVDDVLVFLINQYHNKSNSEIINFFFEMSSDALNYEPNVKNRYKDQDKQIRVIRGFYPGTSMPFKLSVISFPSVTYCKVRLGGKDDAQSILDHQINEYRESAIDSMLLEDTSMASVKEIKYRPMKWKCMRLKGTPLLKKGKQHE